MPPLPPPLKPPAAAKMAPGIAQRALAPDAADVDLQDLAWDDGHRREGLAAEAPGLKGAVAALGAGYADRRGGHVGGNRPRLRLARVAPRIDVRRVGRGQRRGRSEADDQQAQRNSRARQRPPRGGQQRADGTTASVRLGRDAGRLRRAARVALVQAGGDRAEHGAVDRVSEGFIVYALVTLSGNRIVVPSGEMSSVSSRPEHTARP